MNPVEAMTPVEAGFEVTEEAVGLLCDALGIQDGSVPPTLAFVAAYPALRACVARLTAGQPAPGAVHVRQHLALHRPLAPGSRTVTEARPVRVARGPGGTMVSVRGTTRAGGQPLAESEAVLLLLGGESPAVPGPGPRTLMAQRDGDPRTVVRRIDAGAPARYALASGDDNPIHLDDKAARAAGLPGRVVHGMASLGCVLDAVRQARDRVAGGTGPLAEVSCRFVGSLRPGGELRTQVWEGRPRGGQPAGAFVVFHSEGLEGPVLDGVARYAAG